MLEGDAKPKFFFKKIFVFFLAKDEMQNGTTPICIDNTNITKAEMKPYVELVII